MTEKDKNEIRSKNKISMEKWKSRDYMINNIIFFLNFLNFFLFIYSFIPSFLPSFIDSFIMTAWTIDSKRDKMIQKKKQEKSEKSGYFT